MNRLKICIEQRRALEPAALTCIAIGVQTPGVIISRWQRETWALPWSYLLSARCAGPGDSAQLVLSFTTQVVTADGQNLASVLEAVAGFRLSLLRELPAASRPQLPAGAPFVSRIEIRAAEQ